MKEYFGKYRALVAENKDPENEGRIKVRVPFISGDSIIGWCLPCVPVAYAKGGDLNIPKVGSFVWVEFEHGDIRYPIYTGSIYGADGLPLDDIESRLISWGNSSILMSKDQLILKSGDNAFKITPEGIEIQGSIKATRVRATYIDSTNLTATLADLSSITANNITASGNITTNGDISANGNISAVGTVEGSNIYT